VGPLKKTHYKTRIIFIYLFCIFIHVYNFLDFISSVLSTA